jgi:hypothetical protein
MQRLLYLSALFYTMLCDPFKTVSIVSPRIRIAEKNCPKLKLSVDVAGHKTLTVVNPQAVLLGTSVHFRTQWSAHVLVRAYFSTWGCFETNRHPFLRCALPILTKNTFFTCLFIYLFIIRLFLEGKGVLG